MQESLQQSRRASAPERMQVLSTECPEVSYRTCPDCHRFFRSQQCFEQHKHARGDARSVRESLIRCTKCQQTVPRYHQLPEKHQCGLTKCWICGKDVQLEGHCSYIQPETKKKKKPEEEEEEMPEDGYDMLGLLGYRMSTG